MKFPTYFFVLVLSLTAAVEAGKSDRAEERARNKDGTILNIKQRSVAEGPRGVRDLFHRNPKE
jgi:hypothetical protein